MNQLRLIKSLVFIFTFLLIFGCLALVGCFYHRLHHSATSHPAEINLQQKQSATIKQITSDGKLLYILISDSQHTDKVIIYNPNKNNIVSTLITH